MLKRISVVLFAILLVFGLVAWAAPQKCLPTGEYAIAIGDGADIYTMTMHGTKLTEVIKTTFPVKGTPAAGLAADKCNIYIPWTSSGRTVTHIWSVGFYGITAHQVTYSQNPLDSEIQPAISSREGRIAFAIVGPVGSRVGTNVIGSGQYDKLVQMLAISPAWNPSNGDLTYTNIRTGRINPWNIRGSWHTYTPDATHILVRDDNDDLILYPIAGQGTPQLWGKGKIAAFGPHIAAVITLDGKLEFYKLDVNWMPVGNPIQGPGFSNLQSVTWVSVP